METQLDLFDTSPYNIDISPNISALNTSIVLGWTPYSIDKIEKACKMYRITVEQLFLVYEKRTSQLEAIVPEWNE